MVCLHVDILYLKMVDLLDLRVCTFNCRSAKNSFMDINNLCAVHDIVVIQEHWLLPFELGLLSGINDEFLAYGLSAVDISSGILRGRPYGGTAILYRKQLAKLITIISSSEPRLCAARIETCVGPILLANVYMPTDYNDSDSYDEYVDMCTKIHSMFTDSDCVYLMVAGDFNCKFGSRFYDVFCNFLCDLMLVCVDVERLHGIHTYCSDDGQRMSWIDHILCSKPLEQFVSDIAVVEGTVSSDHCPLSACLTAFVPDSATSSSHISSRPATRFYDWSKASAEDIGIYTNLVGKSLAEVNIPSCLLVCDTSCTDVAHHHAISEYYSKIVNCIKGSVEASIPCNTVGHNEYNVPGWTDYVSDKHSAARLAYLDWSAAGKPRSGMLHRHMYTTRAAFKQALRYCKKQKEQMQADACAKSCLANDSQQFWRNVSKIANKKVTSHVNKVGDSVGESEICNLWQEHFYSLYNSVRDNHTRELFLNRSSFLRESSGGVSVSVMEVADAIKDQKKSKSCGPNGLAMEAFIYAGIKAWIHLSIFYTLCIKHCYLPDDFMDINILPTVKNKGGDTTDINNYRAIAISNVDTKILEKIILHKVTRYSEHDRYQFGFKSGHSTSLAAGVVKQVVDYYTTRGSHVFACFVDFRKAFDSVNFWKLFNQLLDDNVDVCLVQLLAYWYSHQEICVAWAGCKSAPFSVSNGTKQGGVLSPYFFTRYISQLLCAVSDSGIGCNIGGLAVNIVVYADDIVLLAPSWHALQELIKLLGKFCDLLDLVCNTCKTVCMVFAPSDKNKIVSGNFPNFTVNGQVLKFVSEFKYLGHIITNTDNDDNDIHREIRNLYVRTNILIRRFSKCSTMVKLHLFKSYCICLYGVGLWKNYSKGCTKKLKCCYHRCIKQFFGYSKFYSVTQMFLELRLPSFNTLIHNYRCIFSSQWSHCLNRIVCYMSQLQLIPVFRVQSF